VERRGALSHCFQHWITKKFGGVVALNKVDLTLFRKEILGLVGDNGAGKSTLIKILSGVFPSDEGEIFVEGKKVQITSPLRAEKLGIRTIYQDLALFDVLDIPSNFFMAKEIVTKSRVLKRKKMAEISQEMLRELGISLRFMGQKVGTLSGGQRHLVAVGRALYRRGCRRNG